ncbi:MAG: fumarylacetoacetate hydrolase family protein [Planctomycetes bacterium]|nr:fumarylacetoacetate hydrolase family protein [Planctomycetota bacterium]
MKYATVRIEGGRTFFVMAEGDRWRVMRDQNRRFYASAGEYLLSGEGLFPSDRFIEEAFSFAAPVPRPPKIVAVGLNYRDHAAEQNKPAPEKPMLFSKASNIVIGPEEPVRIPGGPGAGQVDFECELGIVIGRGGFDVPEDRWQDHVFGFTIVNDVTSREAQYADKQFYRGKSFDTFCPTGPVVVTPDEFDWRGRKLGLRLNGAAMQDGTTANMCFGPPALVAYVSAVHRLEPGDLIATGTPAGVLMFRPEKRFLQPGDVTEAWIEGIGTLKNRFERR